MREVAKQRECNVRMCLRRLWAVLERSKRPTLVDALNGVFTST